MLIDKAFHVITLVVLFIKVVRLGTLPTLTLPRKNTFQNLERILKPTLTKPYALN